MYDFVSSFGFIGWLLSTAGTIFWLAMIIDCWRSDPDRHIWIFILFFFNLPAAVVYFIIRWAPSINWPIPAFVKRMKNRRRIERLEAATRTIGNAQQFRELGDLYLELGLVSEARKSYETALEKDEQDLRAHWGAAQAATACRELETARRHLEYIITTKDSYKYGEAYLAYVRTLVALGDDVMAMEHLPKVIARWPYPEACVHLATLLIEAGKPEESRPLLEKVVNEMKAIPDFSYRRHSRWIRQATRMLRSLP